MAEEGIRVGRVSSVNPAEGMVSVVYFDRNNEATDEFPMLNFNGEYKMPKKGDMVVVLHLSNGSSAGIVLGTFWNDGNMPPVTDGFYKDMGGANMSVSGGNLVFQDASGSVMLREIIAKCK